MSGLRRRSRVQLTEREAALRSRFEVPVMIAAIMVVPVLFWEQSEQAWVRNLAYFLDWMIWLAFLAEFAAMVYVVRDKAAYARRAWIDVFIILTSFPLFRVAGVIRILRLGRIPMALRVLRLVRLASVLTRGAAAARAVFKTSGVAYFAVITVILTIGGGAAVAMVEPEVGTPLDGVWWALVTVTTVGYGDITPTTTSGRMVALFLMVFGLAFVSLVTAAIAARFVAEDDAHAELERREILERLARIEGALLGGIPTEARADRVRSS